MDITIEDIHQEKMVLVKHQIQYFLNHELFTWQWWFLVALSFLPWLLWIKIRDKNRQGRLLLGGIFIGLIALIADTIGTQIGLWFYDIKFTPSIPPMLPYDLALMPVSFMIIQQFTKTRMQWVVTVVLFSIFTAFIFEPFLVFIDIYRPTVWEHVYSVVLYYLYFWVGSKVHDIEGWQKK